MKQIIQKRVVPVSVATLACFALLAVFQLFVLAGGPLTRAATVKRFAPWAYEPFLRLTGEHPDTRPAWSMAGEKAEKGERSASAMADVAGIRPEDSVVVENPLLEPTRPADEPEIVIPAPTSTNQPAAPIDEDVPVG